MGVVITINNYFSNIKGDPRIVKSISEALKFRHPQAFYIKKRVGPHWDGFVNPVTEGGRFRTGLLPRVVELLHDLTDEVGLMDNRDPLDIQDIPTHIVGVELRDYQVEAISSIIHNLVLGEPFRIGLIIAAVNAGKTFIMMGLHMSLKGAKTLLIVDNSLLYDQMVGDAKKVFGDEAGYLRGKDVKWGKFTVAMVKSLNNRLKDYTKELSTFNCLLVDEADLGASATHQNIYKTLTNCSVRLGFTGTAFMRNLAKDRLKNNTLREQFGEPMFEIDMKTLEDIGVSTKTLVRILPGLKPRKPQFNFNDEFREVIADNPKRWKQIEKRLKLHWKMGRTRIMVFNKFKDQTEALYEYLKNRIPGAVIKFTHSDNKSFIEAFKRGEVNILITSLYMKRGINIPDVQVIINNSGGEGYANPLQIIGRGTRKHDSKGMLYFEDFFDEGKYLSTHSKRRLSYYKARKLRISDLRT